LDLLSVLHLRLGLRLVVALVISLKLFFTVRLDLGLGLGLKQRLDGSFGPAFAVTQGPKCAYS